MYFADALTARTKETAPVCVGLDPRTEKLPEGIPQDPAGVLEFCKGIIDAVKDIAVCVKPQLAYFEVLGWEGMKVFWEVCSYAKEQGLFELQAQEDCYCEFSVGYISTAQQLSLNLVDGIKQV